MKIQPWLNHIQIKIETPSAGMLNTSSKSAAMEYAEIVALGEGLDVHLKVGDKIFVKSWAIDIIDYEGEKYYFVDLETGGLKGTVR